MIRRWGPLALCIFAVICGVFTIVATAQAHRIPEADAESRWYFVFNNQCDVGGDCSLRKATLDCDPRDGAPHAWNCLYEYRQERSDFPFGKEYRWCHITGALRHTTVWSSTKNCGAWA